MKTFRYLLLLAVIALVNSQSGRKFSLEDFLVVEAIKGIFKTHFAVKQSKVDLIFDGPKSELLAGKVLRQKPLEVSVRLLKLDILSKSPFTFPTIFLFDSGEDFDKYEKTLSQNSLVNNQASVTPNLLFYVAAKGNRLEFKDRLVSIGNSNFIKIVNDSTIDLVAGYFVGSEQCGSTQYKRINRFSARNMKWENEIFFPNKYETLNECDIREKSI